MITIQQALNEGRQQLSELIEHPQNEALLLLEHVTEQRREFLIAHADESLESETYQHYQTCLSRRISGEPLAYITQQKEFWSLTLDITPSVLIPRPETELLIEATLQLIDKHSSLNILDLGTGSGCIALALASELPQAHIYATDNSASCITLAQQNASKLKLSNVNFVLSDWYQAITRHDFDIVVSNPPYIAPDDDFIQANVHQFEPSTALFSEQHGYADLYKIIQQAPNYLAEGGTLLVEHGFQQSDAVQECFSLNHFSQLRTLKDLQQHDRVTLGRMQ